MALSLTLSFFPLLSRPRSCLHLFPPVELWSRLGSSSPAFTVSGRSEHFTPAWGDPPAPRELGPVVWHRSGTRCHLQMLTSPITASEPSPFPISSSDPACARRVGAICRGRRGTGWDWGCGQSRAVPQPTPGTAGGARGVGDPPHRPGDTSKKHLFLAQDSCPNGRRCQLGRESSLRSPDL